MSHRRRLQSAERKCTAFKRIRKQLKTFRSRIQGPAIGIEEFSGSGFPRQKGPFTGVCITASHVDFQFYHLCYLCVHILFVYPDNALPESPRQSPSESTLSTPFFTPLFIPLRTPLPFLFALLFHSSSHSSSLPFLRTPLPFLFSLLFTPLPSHSSSIPLLTPLHSPSFSQASKGVLGGILGRERAERAKRAEDMSRHSRFGGQYRVSLSSSTCRLSSTLYCTYTMMYLNCNVHWWSPCVQSLAITSGRKDD